MHAKALDGKPEEKRVLQECDVDGSITLKRILQEYGASMWTGSSGSARDQWWDFVSKIMNIKISQKTGNFLTS
jgi:hypothetical protein